VPTSTIPHFLQAGCPSCRPTNSVKALKADGCCKDDEIAEIFRNSFSDQPVCDEVQVSIGHDIVCDPLMQDLFL